MVRTILAASLAAALVAAAAAPVHADAAGDQALAAVDAAMNRAKTQYLEYAVVNQEPGKDATRMAETVRIKGDKRLTELTAPAAMKGTKVLVLSPTEIYVYLPAFGKVRRVASSVTDQGFLGMTFSQDDFLARYAPLYTATIAADSAKELQLTLTPKPGQTTPYAKILMTVRKDKMLPTALAYLDAAGHTVKNETRGDYRCQGTICTATTDKMIDNTKSGTWTTLTRTAWKVNEAMSDDLFSKRALGE
ncbi:MAG TPA: outer membrane lipoprotein-sorting protein [Kofleriaceae bacterium]|nr:outer membrane lipoprotein-sorting protein [Kofleriaceae bacterium]